MFKGRQKHYKLYEEFIQTIDLRNLLVYWKGIYSTKILPKMILKFTLSWIIE